MTKGKCQQHTVLHVWNYMGGIEGTIVLTGFFIQIKFCFKGFNSKFKHVKPLKVLYIKPLLPSRRKKTPNWNPCELCSLSWWQKNVKCTKAPHHKHVILAPTSMWSTLSRFFLPNLSIFCQSVFWLWSFVRPYSFSTSAAMNSWDRVKNKTKYNISSHVTRNSIKTEDDKSRRI